MTAVADRVLTRIEVSVAPPLQRCGGCDEIKNAVNN